MPAVSFALAHIDTKTHSISNSNSCETTRSPLSALRSTSAYYHPQYPSNSSKADLVLASSDKVPCWFAINRDQLFCRDDAFRSVGLEIVTPDTNLPLVKLGESRAVIEVILACLQADTIPDFGNIEFRVLVSALEAAADKYRLVHIEKMCLLALGAYCKTHPVEVYTLASHYSCRWLAEAASEYTLSVDITQPEYQDILTSENHQLLVELHHHRIQAAKSIVRSQCISPHQGKNCNFEKLASFWAQASERIVSRITKPLVDFQELFSPELALALEQFPTCPRCYAALVEIELSVQKQWSNVRRNVIHSSAIPEPHFYPIQQSSFGSYPSDGEESI